MKKLLTFALSAIIVMLSACTKDNTCVKQMAEIITKGAEQYKAIDAGELTIEELSDDLFKMPNGNIFANDEIYSIIEANKDYELTKEDKEILKNAVNKFVTEGEDISIDIMSTNTAAHNADATIDQSKTMKDLYYYGGTL
ncbi:MAG: hypothetical protein ACI31C_07650 [Muribaculaceae bacterium]